jgi:Fic family protein
MGGVEEGKYPAGTYAKQIFHRLLIDLSWNSSRLEGNTYSLLETERLVDWGNAASGKDLKETQMILNHKAAIEFLINSAETTGINRFTILNLHTLLSDNLMPNPAASGRLRTFSVGISHSTYLPIAIPQVIEECFDLLIAKASSIKDPFEQAFFLLVQVPYLQAFDDVNKRTSRLAANIPLIRNNLCPLSFVDMPEQIYINGLLGIYELNRVELLRDVFAWAYERSCALYSTTRQTIGEPDPFRMQYRNAIKQVVSEVVRRGMNKTQAVSTIREQALSSIPLQDRPRFIETVERELLSLHEGNIARYQLQPTDYERWKKSWK